MKNSIIRDATQVIQQLVAEESGGPLRPEAAAKLEDIIAGLLGDCTRSSTREDFLNRKVTILLADLRGFGAISDAYPIGTVLETINRYLSKMSEVVILYQGEINKFMGDSIMVLFWPQGEANDDVMRAIACAVDMQIAMDDLNASNKEAGIPELYMGIGINTGNVMAGLLGSALYSEFTVIGDEVNLASRIEAFSLRGQVLISENTFAQSANFAKTGDPMAVFVKGKNLPVKLREVLGIPSQGKEMPRREIRNSPRVKIDIPFTYQVVINKIVMPEVHRATVLDISYHGIQVAIDQPLEANTEIKFEISLPFIGYQTADIYAKILRVRQEGGRYLASTEFTSVSVQCSANIKYFVQLLVQSIESK